MPGQGPGRAAALPRGRTLTPPRGFARARRHQSFYVDTMEEDGRRVERLFKDAAALGILIQARTLAPNGGVDRALSRGGLAPLQRRSVSLDEMQRLILSGQYLIIALVDKRKARCT